MLKPLRLLGRTSVIWLTLLTGLGSFLLKPRPARAAMSCSESVADMQFGSINVVPGTRSTSTTTAAISCSGASANTTYRFCVNERPGTDRVGNQRRMIAGSDFLPFNLYSDAAYATPFGSWPAAFLGGGVQIDLTSNGAGLISGNLTIYGEVPTSASDSPPACMRSTRRLRLRGLCSMEAPRQMAPALSGQALWAIFIPFTPR